MPSQPSEEGDARFSWLLQPIRDLTKNWNIDVASLLEKYLSELENISISFDGGTKSMNFAEAALLIQGSACIYSKKVEYLYALVYQTLDLITKSKRNQQPSSVDNEGKDADVSLGKTQVETFLELDDIQEAKNIDLKEEEDDLKLSEKSYLIPKTPLALLPTSEMSKRGEDVLMSHKGEIIGSRKDFKMNICTVHHSGALLLDTNCIPMLERSLKALYSSTPLTSNLVAPVGHVFEERGQEAKCDEDQDLPMDDGFDDDGVDFGPPSPQMEVEDSQKTPPRRHLRDRNAMRNDAHQPRLEDPWEGLNPYDDSNFTNKVFKKGKPYRIPISTSQLSQEIERKRKRTKKSASQRVQRLETLTSFLLNSSPVGMGTMPTNPLKRPTSQEFNSAFVEEYCKRQDLCRREREYLRRRVSEEVFQDLNSVADPVGTADEGDSPNFDQDDDVYNDDSGEDAHAEFDGGIENNDISDPSPGDHMNNNNNWDDCVVSSYEDLVRKYVHNCLLEAQQYAQETDISRRVKNWEEKIVPVLEEEERHRPYDIHTYAKEILDRFEDKEINFRDMVSGKEPYEVCRYFLSTLLMANMRNIDIVETEGLELDMMRLRLLDRTPAHEKISEYLAPSLQSGHAS